MIFPRALEKLALLPPTSCRLVKSRCAGIAPGLFLGRECLIWMSGESLSVRCQSAEVSILA